jgi:hypothetical protein
MDTVAAPVLHAFGRAQITPGGGGRFNAGDHRIGNRFVGRAVADDDVILDAAIVRLPDVDAVQRIENVIIMNECTSTCDVNRRAIIGQVSP